MPCVVDDAVDDDVGGVAEDPRAEHVERRRSVTRR